MRFCSSIFTQVLKAIDRDEFRDIVSRYKGDAYGKSFDSWAHMVALVYAQLSAVKSLRGLEAGFNAQSQHHYHFGCGKLQRSTLADANKRRPFEIFAEVFALLGLRLDRKTRRDGDQLVRLIDSTPIPLGKLYDWAAWNGRIRGMKVHVVYDPGADYPRILDVTDANVNDAQVGRAIQLEPNTTYVVDKGYCHYGWWTAIDAVGSIFVTRPKTNMVLELIRKREVTEKEGDGFTILEDCDVKFASKGDSKLPISLRRVKVRRHENGDEITLITNDLVRSACQIAALYKGRWQIELLFRWIKQHLKIKKFLGRNPNAIRLQIYAAMIAFALLRIAKNTYRIELPILRLTDLVIQCLFERRNLGTIDRPPPVNLSRKRLWLNENQLELNYV